MSDIAWGESHIWIFGGTLFVIAVLSKMIFPFFIKNLSKKKKMIIGLSMVPRGEVGLIFAEIGRVAEIFNSEVYAAMLLVIILTTLLPPFLIKLAYDKLEDK